MSKKGEVRFIRKGGRVIPIRIKRGSALQESATSVRRSADTGAITGALGLTAASKFSKEGAKSLFRGVKGGGINMVSRVYGKKEGLKTLARGVSKAFSRRSSIIEIGATALIGSIAGTIAGRRVGANREAKRLQKRFGKPTIKNIRKAGITKY